MLTLHRKSLDMRAKQRLSYRVVFLPLTCAVAVSPHVNSIVRHLSVFCHKIIVGGVLSMSDSILYLGELAL